MKRLNTFHEFAAWVDEKRQRPTFTEAVLQDKFVEYLEESVWANLAIGRLKPRNVRGADILLFDRRGGRLCVAIELKNAPELTHAHQAQARRYSEEHLVPCVLTNGFEYHVIVSVSHEEDFSYDGLDGRRTDSYAMHTVLGDVDPHRFHEPLELQLQQFFQAAYEGRGAMMRVLGKLEAATRSPKFPSLLGAAPRQLPAANRQDGESDSIVEGNLPTSPSVNVSSASAVAKALKRELKGMRLTVSEDSKERATICLNRLQIVRITQFQFHCRVSVRQPDSKQSSGSDITGRGWRADTITVRDPNSIREVVTLVRKLWDT